MTTKIDQLFESLEGQSQALIMPHNDPDPDAIAAAVGLRYLLGKGFGISARIVYRGIIGRAENRALVRYLNYPLHKLEPNELQLGIPIALVDTQPGAGNNPLPKDTSAALVIDHHPWREATANVKFFDIRAETGASATILTEYIQMANLPIPTSLATALFYGIKTDTMGLGRGASKVDAAAYAFLQPLVDVSALVLIERAQVPLTYFKSLTTALQAAHLYGGDLLISYIGVMKYPDLGAEIADLLLRLQGIQWVICMGVYNSELILSVRSRSRQIGAGKLVQQIVGNLGAAGGHGSMAGGHIKLSKSEPKYLSEQLTKLALQYIKGDASISGAPML